MRAGKNLKSYKFLVALLVGPYDFGVDVSQERGPLLGLRAPPVLQDGLCLVAVRVPRSRLTWKSPFTSLHQYNAR